MIVFSRLLELAAVLRAGDDQRDVQGEDSLVEQLREGPCRSRCAGPDPSTIAVLPTPGLADQDRVVLGPPAEDLDHPFDFVVATDQRVQRVVDGGLGQVAGELDQAQRFLGPVLRVFFGRAAAQFLAHHPQPQTAFAQDLGRDGFLLAQQTRAACARCRYVCGTAVSDSSAAAFRARLLSSENGRSTEVETFSRIMVRPSISLRMLSIEALAFGKKAVGEILVLPDQSEKQMLSFNRRAAELAGFVTCEENDPAGLLCVLFKHMVLCSS